MIGLPSGPAAVPALVCKSAIWVSVGTWGLEERFDRFDKLLYREPLPALRSPVVQERGNRLESEAFRQALLSLQPFESRVSPGAV